ncbi:carboxypeptidase-like regulatory domain-containing protein [Deinococcus humi]|uniref:Carboxypeptidase regulatory-like domain-containing protein n=1 Tax=Deinococcus humi TaxID=662880 RepID=A0A7W8JWW5_9DEIO|nr:carboxypeptidase-like regulatory domain-containing protein [Deinococcus humi]MBB5364639.1 hypothetical protein [Deinococcus humi]GGO39060.1 hypothetical protein GCM10008949_46610 [Deinococcus humi]
MSTPVKTLTLSLSVLFLATIGLSATANTVSGRVVDERGKPVSGVRIIIAPAMFRGTLFATSDPRSQYQSIELNPASNPYCVTAYKKVKYHDQKDCLRIAGNPESYQDALNAKAGVIRNFI